jgi:RNA recognition motif-containing protein
MGNRLYVGNLSFHTTEDGIRDAFVGCGDVGEVKIITDRETGRSRGFGFVTMADEKGARTAISKMDGFQLDGRALRVNEAEAREQRGGGGGGGGGGGRSRW